MPASPSLFTCVIDRTLSMPVFEQICVAIRSRAISGDLAEGTLLPSTRALAVELGVSRSTLVTAYEQLVAEGYIVGVRGSGYSVCRIGAVELPVSAPAVRPVAPIRSAPARPLHPGHADMQLFPHRQWARAIARVCRTDPQSMVLSDGSFGNWELREAIARHVSEWRGISATAQQILITAGSGDALEICIRALVQSGDRVGLEDPGYLPLRNFVEGLGLRAEYLEVGQDGASLPATRGANDPKLVVLTPSHQYPLGGAMAPGRRLEFVNWAGQENAWIIEDDYDSEFRYAGRPIPAMAGMDGLNRTIYIGSFSKIFSNSLRLGYIVIPEALTHRFEQVLEQFGVKASYMPQLPLAEFINSGEFYRHLRRVRRIYDERRRFLLGQLSARLGDYGSFQDHQAGMQVVFHLAAGFSDIEVERNAKASGVVTTALSRFATGTGRNEGARHNGLLLGFCGFEPPQIEEAVETLATILGGLAGKGRSEG